MTGHNRTEIFDLAASLDDRECQITEDGYDGIDESDKHQNAVINRDVAVDQLEDKADQKREQGAGQNAADRALDRFVGADIGAQLMLAEVGTRKIRAGISQPRDTQTEDDPERRMLGIVSSARTCLCPDDHIQQ